MYFSSLQPTILVFAFLPLAFLPALAWLARRTASILEASPSSERGEKRRSGSAKRRAQISSSGSVTSAASVSIACHVPSHPPSAHQRAARPKRGR